MREAIRMNTNIEYRQLGREDITLSLFVGFNRRQEIVCVWKPLEGGWALVEEPSVEDWGVLHYRKLVDDLRRTVDEGGTVFAAFEGQQLAGFACIRGTRFGSRWQYAELCSIHVTCSRRREGIGRRLFGLCACAAAERGAELLYISAHPAEETVAFYTALGCTEAQETNEALAARTPAERQLEYAISEL